MSLATFAIQMRKKEMVVTKDRTPYPSKSRG
jgi:hypothetical protein